MYGQPQQTDWQERAEAYKRRVDLLEEELDLCKEELRSLSGMKEYDPSLSITFGLTESEAQILQFLLDHPVASHDRLFHALYASSIDEQPDMAVIKVFVCKLRTKLIKHGCEIGLQWGQGYFLTIEQKEKIRNAAKSIRDMIDWKD